MVANRRTAASLALMLAIPLAACGGAGGGGPVTAGSSGGSGGGTVGGGSGGGGTGGVGGGGGGSPQGYPSFAALAGDQTFNGPVAQMDTRGTTAQGTSSQGYVDVNYSAANGTYTLNYFGFDPEVHTLTAAPLNGRTLTMDGHNAPGLGLTYTRLLTWTSEPGFTNRGEITWGVIGVPTRADDRPTGKADYETTAFVGNAVRLESGQNIPYDLKNSQFRMTYDFATDLVDARFTLIGTPLAGGADVALGEYYPRDNSARFPLTRDGLAAGDYAGFWDEKFFGPQAAEFGISFQIYDPTAAQPLSAAGVVLGRKK